MFTDAFSVVEFDYRVVDDGPVIFFERVPRFWGVVVAFGDGESRVLFETDRRGLAFERLHELRKLLCDEASEWRSRLPKGLDAEFGLWLYGKPTREQEINDRREYLRQLWPDGVPADLALDDAIPPGDHWSRRRAILLPNNDRAASRTVHSKTRGVARARGGKRRLSAG